MDCNSHAESFDQIVGEYIQWANATFDTHPQQAIEGIKREVKELEESLQTCYYLDAATEAADIIFYCLYTAYRNGASVTEIREAMSRKLEINKGRKWKKNQDGTYSHFKDLKELQKDDADFISSLCNYDLYGVLSSATVYEIVSYLFTDKERKGIYSPHVLKLIGELKIKNVEAIRRELESRGYYVGETFI